MFSIKPEFLAVAMTGIIFSTAAQAVDIQLDPSATYLRFNEYTSWGTPKASVAYSLSDLGFSAGDTIRITRHGDFMSTYANWGGVDTSTSLMGVFSSTNELLGPLNPLADPNTLMVTPLNRVTGAIATTLANKVTNTTYHNALSTDITEDFGIGPNGPTVVIPLGAQYIFFSPNESIFGDNVDPDGDYGVSLTLVPVPEASSYAMLLAGLGVLGVVARRRKAMPSGSF